MRTMKRFAMVPLVALSFLWGVRSTAEEHGKAKPEPRATAKSTEADRLISAYAAQMIEDGRRIFRYDTFGSEAFWGDTLQLHQAIAGEKNGGVGPGVSPEDRALGRAQGRCRRSCRPP